MGMAHYYQKVINFSRRLSLFKAYQYLRCYGGFSFVVSSKNVTISYQSAAANRCDTGLCGYFSQIYRQTIPGTSKKASISKTRKPLRQLALRAAVNGHWRRKAPMPFSCSFFGALEACSNSPKTGSKSLSGTGMLPSPKESHTGAHKGKQGKSAACSARTCYTR